MNIGGSECGGAELHSTTELADNDVKVFEEIRMIQEEEDKCGSEFDAGTGKASHVSK